MLSITAPSSWPFFQRRAVMRGLLQEVGVCPRLHNRSGRVLCPEEEDTTYTPDPYASVCAAAGRQKSKLFTSVQDVALMTLSQV